MQAVKALNYGTPDVLKVVEIDKPTPKDTEVLIKIHAVPVGYGDVLARDFRKVTPRSFGMPGPLWYPTRIAIGLRKPNRPILGAEFSGVIETVGDSVTRFKPGDAVIGYTGSQFGANAEYLCLPEKGIITHKPSNLSHAEACSLPYGGMIALGLLKNMNIQPGQKVLINGASGGIGVPAVQIAKLVYGAEVTAVCGAKRHDYVRALGADHVIDYKTEDFTQGGARYDLVLDVLGRSDFKKVKRVLKPGGTLLYASFKMKPLMQMLLTSLRRTNQRVKCLMVTESVAALEEVASLAEAGKLNPVVDRRFLLEQTANAHRYYESGEKQGAVVIVTSS